MKSNFIPFLISSLQETQLLFLELLSSGYFGTFPDVKHSDLAIRETGPFLCHSQTSPKSSHSLYSCLYLTLHHSLPVLLHPFCHWPQSALPPVIARFPHRGGYVTTIQEPWENCKIGSMSSKNLKHNGEGNWSIDSMHMQSKSQQTVLLKLTNRF